MKKLFDNTLSDAQGTEILPINPDKFDLIRYSEYEQSLLERCQTFQEDSSGVLVYRRFRVPQVFSYGCRDMKLSLALQLAALNESMKYKADVPNFLEPWYGIGLLAGAYGKEYRWEKNNAPAIDKPFATLDEALKSEIVPIHETSIGKHNLEMIEYFIDATKGKLPVSFADMQSPLNAASFLIETNNFYLSFYEEPEKLRELIIKLTNLSIEYNQKQMDLLRDVLALPGHGFASCRTFTDLGMSCDIIYNLPGDLYLEFESEGIERISAPFAGTAFHSCGNWSEKIEDVKKLKNLKMVDAAFSPETDPDSNMLNPFLKRLRNTGISLNARMVGDSGSLLEIVRNEDLQDMKIIFVSYCKTPEDQEIFYNFIRSISD